MLFARGLLLGKKANANQKSSFFSFADTCPDETLWMRSRAYEGWMGGGGGGGASNENTRAVAASRCRKKKTLSLVRESSIFFTTFSLEGR